MPELLGAVESPTHDAVFANTKGKAPGEGSRGEMQNGEGLCQGHLFVCHMCDINDSALIQDQASVAELSCHTTGLYSREASI